MKVGSLWNWISVLQKAAAAGSLVPFHHVRNSEKALVMDQERGPHSTTLAS